MKSNTVILCEGRGDYVTGVNMESDGKPEIQGGSKVDAIRYTAEEAQEFIESMGEGFSAEVIESGFKVIRNDGRDVLRNTFESKQEAEDAIKGLIDPTQPFTYRVVEA